LREDKWGKIGVIIPAFNEEASIAKVIGDIPEFVEEIVVGNNASTDETAREAINAGATVLLEERRGYGYACLKGIHYFNSLQVKPDIIVFLDGDYSDYPEQMLEIIKPILTGNADMVIGSRALGNREVKSMTAPQVFGNWLATSLIRLFYKVQFTDLGPFRAIKLDKLNDLNMEDTTYGWTVEMQVKAAKKGYKSVEVPVDYKARIGKSKVSGTVKGTIMAGYKILWTIFKYL